MFRFSFRLTPALRKDAMRSGDIFLRVIATIFAVCTVAIIISGVVDHECTVIAGFAIYGLWITISLFNSVGLANKGVLTDACWQGDGALAEYTFDEDGFSLVVEKEGVYHSTEQRSYDAIYRLNELPRHYLLYLSSSLIQILPKDGLTEGNVEALNDFFRDKLGKRFHPAKPQKAKK